MRVFFDGLFYKSFLLLVMHFTAKYKVVSEFGECLEKEDRGRKERDGDRLARSVFRPVPLPPSRSLPPLPASSAREERKGETSMSTKTSLPQPFSYPHYLPQTKDTSGMGVRG